MFMYPMTFDEFLLANNEDLLLEARNAASSQSPLPEPLHKKLVSLLRTYMLVGGMPECVGKWVETHDYLLCALNLLILAGLLIPVTHTSANHPITEFLSIQIIIENHVGIKKDLSHLFFSNK